MDVYPRRHAQDVDGLTVLKHGHGHGGYVPIPRKYQMPQVALGCALGCIDANAVTGVGGKHGVGVAK